jgi:hypothetical protein
VSGVEESELALEGVLSSWEQFFASTSEEDADAAMRERMHNLRSRPFVAIVDEERIEEELARLREHPGVAAATRNWRVSLDSPVAGMHGVWVSPGELLQFLVEAGMLGDRPLEPAEAQVRIAVLDSGVDDSAFLFGNVLDPVQIDAAGLGSALRTNPYDPDGHGSVVAGLIHCLAPDARITSVRCFGQSPSSLADVVYGLLFARLLDEPIDVFNLSFSVDYSVDECPRCRHTFNTRDERTAMRNLFDHLRTELDDRPIFVAAAGNAGGTVAIPAALDGTLAVGSTGASPRGAPYADPSYEQVPGDFLLAPGGSKATPIATPKGPFVGRHVFGTSFATAIATGTMARILGNPAAHGIPGGRDEDRRQAAFQALRRLADTSFPGYDPTIHGMGVIGRR